MQELKQELPCNINALTKTVIPIYRKGKEQPVRMTDQEQVGTCTTSAVGYTAYGELSINDGINLDAYKFTYSMAGGNLVAVNIEAIENNDDDSENIRNSYREYLQSLIDNIPEHTKGGSIDDLRNNLKSFKNIVENFSLNVNLKINEILGGMPDGDKKATLFKELETITKRYAHMIAGKIL